MYIHVFTGKLTITITSLLPVIHIIHRIYIIIVYYNLLHLHATISIILRLLGLLTSLAESHMPLQARSIARPRSLALTEQLHSLIAHADTHLPRLIHTAVRCHSFSSRAKQKNVCAPTVASTTRRWHGTSAGRIHIPDSENTPPITTGAD